MTRIFDAVEAYRAAFSYRDVAAEVELLTAWHSRHRGGVPARVLELAAGPGDHALEFARRGAAVTALDLSPAMCAWATRQAAAAGLPLEVVEADMTRLRLSGDFELAILLLDSASLVLTDGAMTGLLAGVARHLVPGGLFIMDLSVDRPGAARPDWTVETREAGFRIRWGAPGDAHDPATGVDQVRVRIDVTRRGGDAPEPVVDEIVPGRRWTAGQVVALGAAGGWELLARYGAMDRDVGAGRPGTDRDVLVLGRG